MLPPLIQPLVTRPLSENDRFERAWNPKQGGFALQQRYDKTRWQPPAQLPGGRRPKPEVRVPSAKRQALAIARSDILVSLIPHPQFPLHHRADDLPLGSPG